MKHFTNSLTTKLHLFSLKQSFIVYAAGLFLLASTGCAKYGKGKGGTVFFACDDCVPPKTVYVYVDGNKVPGRLEQSVYNVVCGPPCDKPDEIEYAYYPNYIGPEGVHLFEVKDLSGTVFQTGSFTVTKNQCARIQVVFPGC